MPLKPLLLITLLAACTSPQQPNVDKVVKTLRVKTNGIDKPKEETWHRPGSKPPYKPQDCTTAEDTIFKNGDYIKYINIDTMFGVEVKINNIIDTLTMRFNCNITNRLIPNIYRHRNKGMLLRQGVGQHYCNIISLFVQEDSIVAEEYEASLVNSEARRFYVYKMPGNSSDLYLDDFWHNRIKIKHLPPKYQNMEIEITHVFADSIIINFKNEKELKLKI
jgi:hypothetical protein